jgi:phytoene dehydrogenase-like protein
MAHFGIVGSGIGGIALAIRMACLGQKVVVFEANEYPGGKLSQIDLKENGSQESLHLCLQLCEVLISSFLTF